MHKEQLNRQNQRKKDFSPNLEALMKIVITRDNYEQAQFIHFCTQKKKKKETKYFVTNKANYNMDLLQFAISNGGKVVKHKQEIS